jgi:16S rRNA (guanine(966)-N(2))-methyltransferase RsmD
MRVIAGSAKGRRLKLVPGDTTRPIMDRVKEALFSIIGHDIIDSVFLDLYAGTGSVGIEALSRGAAHATFIDLEKPAIQTIQENLKTTQLEQNALVRRADALAVLTQPPPRPYDMIFVAPPQYKGLWLTTLNLFDQNPVWLLADPQIIVQIDPHERRDVSLESLTHLQVFDERLYGNTLLLFLESKTDPSAPTHEEINEPSSP